MNKRRKEEIVIYCIVLFAILFMTIAMLGLGASESGNFKLAFAYIGVDALVAGLVLIVIKIIEDL